MALEQMTNTLALIGPIGTWEAVVILVVGLLIFGRRLPEVGRSVGKGIVEFRKGLAGVEREVEEASRKSGNSYEQAKEPVPLPSGERVAQARNPLPSESGQA